MQTSKLLVCSDGSLIGDAVWRADLSGVDRQRICAFVELLQDCSLVVCNTMQILLVESGRSVKFDVLF